MTDHCNYVWIEWMDCLKKIHYQSQEQLDFKYKVIRFFSRGFRPSRKIQSLDSSGHNSLGGIITKDEIC